MTATAATIARQAAEAAYQKVSSPANLKTLKEASDAEMNEYLAGFDARNADREYTTTVPAKATESAHYAPWFIALMDRNELCSNLDLFERQAYSGYVAYSHSMTDGYFAPVDFDAWVGQFRKDPIVDLYHGNDKRHALAPQVRSYVASLGRVTLTEPSTAPELPARKEPRVRRIFSS